MPAASTEYSIHSPAFLPRHSPLLPTIQALNTTANLKLPETILLEHGTIRALVAHLVGGPHHGIGGSCHSNKEMEKVKERSLKPRMTQSLRSQHVHGHAYPRPCAMCMCMRLYFQSKTLLYPMILKNVNACE